MKRQALMLCGSCLALVIQPEDREPDDLHCKYCDSVGCEGPCWCESCLDFARDLLIGKPMPVYEAGEHVDGKFWQKGVNWSRRGVFGEPIECDQLKPFIETTNE